MAKGTFRSESGQQFYTIILERCKEETLHIILGENSYCKSDDEIKDVIGFNAAVHLYFIDNYVDVSNYNSPNTKFFYRIENSLQMGSYPINHLNLNPNLIKSHNGLIFDKTYEEISYSYERNDVFTYNDDNKTYTVYYFWLNNRVNYYERTYRRIQNIISNIGGIYQFITFVTIYLNSFYNNYIVLFDTENLLNSSIYYEKNNFKNIKKLKRLKDMNKINNKKHDKTNANKIFEKHDFIKEKSKNKKLQNTNIKESSKSYYDFCISDIGDKNNTFNNKIENNENYKKDQKDTIINTFWKYILFKFSIDKNNSFQVYQNFRVKLISGEHLIKNHLNIYNLLRINEKKIKSKRHYSYNIKDLLKLV